MRLCAISHAKGVRVRQLNIRVAISNVNSHTLADWCILQQRFVSWVHLQILPTFVHCCVNELNRHTKILPNVNFTLVCLQAIDIQPLTLGKMAMQRTIIPSRESCVGNQQTDLSPRTATLDKQYSKDTASGLCVHHNMQNTRYSRQKFWDGRYVRERVLERSLNKKA